MTDQTGTLSPFSYERINGLWFLVCDGDKTPLTGTATAAVLELDHCIRDLGKTIAEAFRVAFSHV